MAHLETYRVTITGKMPLLMHADNIDWSDYMDDWKNRPENAKKSKAGDDRTPAWRWVGCLNYDDPKTGVVTIPSEYIMAAMMGSASSVPTGKKGKTFKSASQSGMICRDFHWPLLIEGKPISMAEINKLLKVEVFSEHKVAVEKLGFSLFVKRAGVNGKKHVRVRPRFDNWSTVGEVIVTDEQITERVLNDILALAGSQKGIGDWRPGAPKKPGQFGTFEVAVEKV